MAETACLQGAVDAFLAAGRANESDLFLRDTDRRYLRFADVRNLVEDQEARRQLTTASPQFAPP